MHIEEFRSYCLSKPATSESFPFDESTLVFKVLNKVFAITGLDRSPFQVNLKCDPDYALELREQYHDVQAGFHMNKKHWNTVIFEADLDRDLLISLIDHSYDMVVKGMSKKDKTILASMA